MNGDPLSSFHGGETSSFRRRRLPSFPPAAAEELSNFDAMFSGVSLQSLLLDTPPVSRFSPTPEQQQQQQQQLSLHYSPSPLKMPKQEPLYGFPDFAPASSPFNSLSLPGDSNLCFPLHRLSDLLHSLETLHPQPPQPPPAAARPGPARKRSPADPERKKRAKEKRRKISECMRQLHELVTPQPEKKMDILTTLEEACKHVAYLQQLVKRALELVPSESPPLPTPYVPPHCPMDDDGGMLRMQHLLEKMVNSPLDRAVLCDQGYGVAAAAAATNQQWELLKQQLEEEEATQMRMEMLQQMWLNLEAPPNQYPV